MSIIYPGGDEQVTPNLGLATWGMDEVLAENMILIDAAIGGPTGSIKINGSVVPATNFINSASVTFSVVGSNVSATATSAGSAAWSSLTGTLSNGQVIPYADAGVSRLGAASLAIGNGTAGDVTGSLSLSRVFAEAVGTIAAPQYSFLSNTNYGMFLDGNNAVSFTVTGIERLAIDGVGAVVRSDGVYGWANAGLYNARDAGISRLGAGSLAIGNGTAGDHTASLSMGGSLTLGATGSGTSITTFGNSSGTFNITFPGNGSQLTWGGTTISSVGGVYAGTTNTSITASGGVVTLNGNQAATANTVNVRVLGVAALTAITGVAQYSFEDASTFAPTSGSAAFASIIANPTINQTGGANGTIRVLAAYPVNTALVGTEYLLALGTSSASGPAGTLTDKFTVDNSGNLILNRINKAGADFAGQATVTAGNTTQAVTFAANYTGTGQPVIVLTPTSDPLAAGLPVGYWVTYSGGAGAWTGFTVNIQTALAGNVTFNYIVVGVA